MQCGTGDWVLEDEKGHGCRKQEIWIKSAE